MSEGEELVEVEVGDLKELWRLIVVDDENSACPQCGAYWGNPDESLNFPNRSKVGDAEGVWWWKCYNPECEVDFYDPASGRYE